MALLLMKLRYVPEDELSEILTLLEQHELDCYETTKGTWGISLPALWLVDESRADEAKALLEEYASQRQRSARSDWESLREAGRARTFTDIAREHPVRFVTYIVLIGAVLYLSLVPFLSVMPQTP